MNDETLTEIVSEMRSYNDTPPPRCAWLALADRIEAVSQFREATKKEVGVSKTETTTPTCKESLQVGNAAKMREALEKFSEVYLSELQFPLDGDSFAIYNSDKMEITIPYWRVAELLNEVKVAQDIAKAALSAPPRNCDMLDNETDARVAWNEYCTSENLPRSSTTEGAFVHWLFAEAKGKAE